MLKKTDSGLKELARDFLALGSWVFYVLVLVRILILPEKWTYVNHLFIAGGLILIVDLFLRGKADSYVSRGLVLAFYTSLFYENNLYTIFVILAFVSVVFSSWYVGNNWKKILYGILLGAVGIGLKFVIG